MKIEEGMTFKIVNINGFGDVVTMDRGSYPLAAEYLDNLEKAGVIELLSTAPFVDEVDEVDEVRYPSCNECGEELHDPFEEEEGVHMECERDEDGVMRKDCECTGGHDMLTDPPIPCMAHMRAWYKPKSKWETFNG